MQDEYEAIRKECEKQGYKIADKEFDELLSYAKRKTAHMNKGAGYISYLLPDVIREYFFRCTVNAVSMAVINVINI